MFLYYSLSPSFIAGWMAVAKDCFVAGMPKVGDGDKFATKALAAAEDTSRVLPTSDFRSTEVGRIGVPDSKGAELWETVTTDADSRSLVRRVLRSECVVCPLVEMLGRIVE